MPAAGHASRCFSGVRGDFSGYRSQLCRGYASRRSFLPRPGFPRRTSHPSRAVQAPPSPNFLGDVTADPEAGRGAPARGPRISATWCGPHALGDTRGAGAGVRGGEGSQGRSFCLLSPQLSRFGEKFSLREKKKFLSAACCPILVDVLSHQGGIFSEPHSRGGVSRPQRWRGAGGGAGLPTPRLRETRG